LHKLIVGMRHGRYLARIATLASAASVLACTSTISEKEGAFPALDAVAQARRYDAMQKAFENNQSGEIAYWYENNRVRGRVVPIATIRTSLYGWCREYEERIATDSANHRLVGIACRTESAQWLIVDIRSYVEGRQQSI
jgi:surface antigen